jgi:hypothetical protein
VEITELKVMVKDTELNVILHEIMSRLEKIEHLLETKQDEQPEQKTRKPKTEKKAKEEPVKEEPVKEEPKTAEKQYSESEVRAFLAGLIKTGKQPQVKTLLADFGVNKLSDIPAEKYGDVMEKAEKL